MKKNKLFVGRIEIGKKGEVNILSKNIEHKIFVNESTLKYFHNDEVEYYINKRKRRGKYLAIIERLVKREKERYVGTIQINESFSLRF